MGYAHIPNLYRPEAQHILLFKECYALEKIHGTSAHVSWVDGQVRLSSGGASPVTFAALFDVPALAERFTKLGFETVTVYGEAYGGKEQKQSWRYGPELRFVAFDVQVSGVPGGFLQVLQAAQLVVDKLGLEFVHYERVHTDLASLDAQRDAPSTQAHRIQTEQYRQNIAKVMSDPYPPPPPALVDHRREGVVLRPLNEMRLPNGERICAKHKRDEERETASPRKVVDPSQLEVLEAAEAIALEWVTDTRLEHVLAHLNLQDPLPIERTGEVIAEMIADVLREGAGELVDTKAARSAIGKRAGKLYKARVTRVGG